MERGEDINNEDITVALLSEQLAIKRGYTPEKAKQIKFAAMLHDVGKSLLPHEVLNKPGTLTPAEFEQIKMHTIYGALILSALPGEAAKLAAVTALLHHEWINGQGYWGFNASSLPDFIGIVAICDVYCALIMRRCYKQAWSHEKAIGYIKQKSGIQFCPHVVKDFVSMANEFVNTDFWPPVSICM